ncbi:hypothetical protein I3760_01G036700 [Carya illinoinensis]|nr:hypothetical protein I3760_01G036700 [Carya illinoinensis]
MSTNSSVFMVDAIVSRLKSTAQFDAEADATLLITADTVGTTDTVMGLPKALTEKCILEAL